MKITNGQCHCSEGSSIMLLPIPREWEIYFELDGSVKGIQIKLNIAEENEVGKVHTQI